MGDEIQPFSKETRAIRAGLQDKFPSGYGLCRGGFFFLLILFAALFFWDFCISRWPIRKTPISQRHTNAQRIIFSILGAWAEDHDQAFPDNPGDANANFRELFRKRLVDSESLFVIAEDGISGEGQPDDMIGEGPYFAQALEPGELSFTYVAGLETSSPSSLPLILSGGGPAMGWLLGQDRTPPAKPFSGRIYYTTVSGSAKSMDIEKGEFGSLAKAFGPDWEMIKDRVRLPAPTPAARRVKTRPWWKF